MPIYTQGVEHSFIFLAVVAATLGLIGLFICLRNGSRINRLKLRALAGIGLIIAPMAFSLCLFPVVYSTFNLTHQDFLSTAFWKAELSSGVFAVRVSSYLLTFQFIVSLLRLVRSKRELAKSRRARGVDEDDNANFTIDRRSGETQQWLSGDIALTATLQFTFYLCAVGALWLCAITGVESLYTLLASWCLFFIMDDWVLISDYTYQFRSPAIATHAYKVIAFNIILLALVPAALLTGAPQPLSFGLTLLMLISAMGVGMYTWRSKTFASELLTLKSSPSGPTV